MSSYRLLPVLLLTVGCGGLESEPAVPATTDQQPAKVAVAEVNQALGYLDFKGAVIMPWCAAVLVAPDVAMTAAHCVDEAGPSQLTFNLGNITPGGATGGSYRVRTIVLHPEMGRWQNNLAALILERPVTGVKPANLGSNAEPVGRMESVSYSYVRRGDSGARRSWAGLAQGSIDPITVVPTEGEPNCHSDAGAGIIDAANNLLGFVSTGSRDEEVFAGEPVGVYENTQSCFKRFKVAAVAYNRTFIDGAIKQGVGATIVP